MRLVLADPLMQLQETARHIADVSNECKLQVNKDEYVESFQPNLMDVVHAWSKVLFQFSSFFSHSPHRKGCRPASFSLPRCSTLGCGGGKLGCMGSAVQDMRLHAATREVEVRR